MTPLSPIYPMTVTVILVIATQALASPTNSSSFGDTTPKLIPPAAAANTDIETATYKWTIIGSVFGAIGAFFGAIAAIAYTMDRFVLPKIRVWKSNRQSK